MSEDQGTDGLTAQVDERRVAALVRVEIGPGKADGGGAAMVVDCQVHELFVLGAADELRDELPSEVAVSPDAGDVVETITGEDDVANQESVGSRRARLTAQQHCSVLVVITRKQVANEVTPLVLGRPEFEGALSDH